MALSTPLDFTQRGFNANAGVVTSIYPHSQSTNETPVKVVSAVFNAVDAIAAKGAALAANDIIKLLTIPAGAFVLNVTTQVVTPQGAASTFAMGDTGADAAFSLPTTAWTDANAAAGTLVASHALATVPSLYGKFYAAANTLNMKVGITGAVPTIAVIKVSMTYIQTVPFGS